MIDVAKSANALSRPGIDPRKFVDLGIITAVDVTAAGVHVDVTTIDGVQETAAVAPLYGGPSYGLHLPIDLDRTALLAVPDGKFNLGARVIGTVWDAGDPPPQDVIDNPDDVVLVVKPGQKLRVIVTGGGDVVLEPRDGGKVRIGDEDANDPFARKSDLAAVVDKLNHFIGLYNTHTNLSSGTLPPDVAHRESTMTTPACSPVATST